MFESLKNILVEKWILIQESILLAGCFFLLYLVVHPTLVLEMKTPVFLSDADFLGRYMDIPGGVTDWLSALLMQFWFSDFLAALFLTMCFWATAFLTRKWMEMLTGFHPIRTLHLIPVCLLLLLHSRYEYSLSVTLALITNLSTLYVVMRWIPPNRISGIAGGIIVSVLSFWITGGAFLIFAVLYAAFCIIDRKRIIDGILILAVSFILPYAGYESVFLVPIRQEFLHNLIPDIDTGGLYAKYMIPIFYLLILAIASLIRIAAVRKLAVKLAGSLRLGKIPFVIRYTAEIMLILLGTYLLFRSIYSKDDRCILQVNKLVQADRTQEALRTAMECTIVNPVLLSQTNLALFQSNMLLDRMFMYPQFYGTYGLFMDFESCSAWPMKASDLYWKLGLVNESLHWAHEALELKGPTAEILKRLGTAYMVKGERSAAEKFFAVLKNVPFEREAAEELMNINDNPLRASVDSSITHIKSLMPVENLMQVVKSPPQELELLLKRNPGNRMAFEYLMAYYLLSGNLKGISDHLADFDRFDYTRIPHHIQEAVLIIASVDLNFNRDRLERLIQQTAYNRYMAYQRILYSHRTDRNGAKKELQRQFGNTYWYYLMFVNPASRQREGFNEFQ